MTDAPSLPPRHDRTIEFMRPIPGGVEILCDCATLTELELRIDPGVTGVREIPFLCEGCQTVTWFTLAVNEPQPEQQ